MKIGLIRIFLIVKKVTVFVCSQATATKIQ